MVCLCLPLEIELVERYQFFVLAVRARSGLKLSDFCSFYYS